MRQLLGDNTLKDRILKLPITVQSFWRQQRTQWTSALSRTWRIRLRMCLPPLYHHRALQWFRPHPLSPPRHALPEQLVLQNQVADLIRQVQTLTSQFQGGQRRSRSCSFSRGRPNQRGPSSSAYRQSILCP